MGRRKSSIKKISNKKKAVLATTFKCPFCCNSRVIQCKMNLQEKIGTLHCRRCDSDYSTVINYLSAPIDVYTEWVDAADAQRAANKDGDDEYVEEEDEDAIVNESDDADDLLDF